MKKTIGDSIFVGFQAVLLASKEYASVIDRCKTRTKLNGINYGSLYTLLHVYYYQGDYDGSFKVFCDLLENFSIKKKLRSWGIESFLISPFFYEKNYESIEERAKKLTMQDLRNEERLLVGKYLVVSLYNQGKSNETREAFSNLKNSGTVDPEIERLIPQEVLQ